MQISHPWFSYPFSYPNASYIALIFLGTQVSGLTRLHCTCLCKIKSPQALHFSLKPCEKGSLTKLNFLSIKLVKPFQEEWKRKNQSFFCIFFFTDQFLILEVLKQPLFDDNMMDCDCPTVCDIHFLCVYAGQERDRDIAISWKKALLFNLLEQHHSEMFSICKIEKKMWNFVYNDIFIAWLEQSPVNGVLHCKKCAF
jgi:hypothetical protein